MIVLLAGCVADAPAGSAPDPDALHLLDELATFPEWRLETSAGTIRTILYTDWLPETTANIIRVTEAGYYDGTTVYRVIDDFVIQGGDENESDADVLLAGEGVPLEVKEGLDFGSGAMGLARLTQDDGTAHYFLAEKPALHLSRPGSVDDFVAQPSPGTGQRAVYGEALGPYALYGQAFSGFDVIRAIAAVATDANDRPMEDVVVRSASVHPPPAEADLLNLIVDVHPDVTVGDYAGDLEFARLMVVGHPAVVRFSTDSEGNAPCTLGELEVHGPGGTRWMEAWVPVANDACTWELELRFDEPGAHRLMGVDVDVLPWSDAYAPYTGTAMNGA